MNHIYSLDIMQILSHSFLYSLIVVFLTTLGFPSFAETISVGNTLIKISPPQGFIRATKKIERELSPEEEKVAFLYTSKVNSVRIFSKSLD